MHHPLPPWAGEIDCANWAQFLLKFIVSHPAVTWDSRHQAGRSYGGEYGGDAGPAARCENAQAHGALRRERVAACGRFPLQRTSISPFLRSKQRHLAGAASRLWPRHPCAGPGSAAAGGGWPHRACRSVHFLAVERHCLSPPALPPDQFCRARLRHAVRTPGSSVRRIRGRGPQHVPLPHRCFRLERLVALSVCAGGLPSARLACGSRLAVGRSIRRCAGAYHNLHVRHALDAGGRRAALSLRHPGAVVAGRRSAAVFILRIPEDVSLLVAARRVLPAGLEAPTAIAKSSSELRNTSHLKKPGRRVLPDQRRRLREPFCEAAGVRFGS